MKKALVGYQVYSARAEAEKDLRGVLEQIKKIGYDGVEFAGFYGHAPEDVRRMVDEVGLVPISSHYPWQLIEKDMYMTISIHKTIGCEYIAIPYLDEATRPGSAGFSKTLRNIYKFGALCRGAGLTLMYHNHDFEFQKLSGEYGLDFLYNAVPEEYLATEIDCCWVKYAGEDPAAYIRKYAGRCPIVHLKDYVGVKGGKQPYDLLKSDGEGASDGGSDAEVAFEFRPVGHGCQDVKSLVEAGIESGAKWFIVEQDLSLTRPPLEAAKMSLETIRNLGV
ncbi:MAG: sugar phosphate isomerase/epimerase family protein [Christensenellales bacterium]|jgi:sugar phosphate isomerase/epimerase